MCFRWVLQVICSFRVVSMQTSEDCMGVESENIYANVSFSYLLCLTFDFSYIL